MQAGQADQVAHGRQSDTPRLTCQSDEYVFPMNWCSSPDSEFISYKQTSRHQIYRAGRTSCSCLQVRVFSSLRWRLLYSAPAARCCVTTAFSLAHAPSRLAAYATPAAEGALVLLRGTRRARHDRSRWMVWTGQRTRKVASLELASRAACAQERQVSRLNRSARRVFETDR